MTVIRYIFRSFVFSVMVYLCTTTHLWAQSIDSLQDSGNASYEMLVYQSRELRHREDSISSLVNNIRREYINTLRDGKLTDNDRSQYSTYIVELEQQIYNLRALRSEVTKQINAIEQSSIFSSLLENRGGVATTKQEDEYPNAKPYLTDNDLFREDLSEQDYAELIAAQRMETAIESMCHKYIAVYSKMRNITERYATESDEHVADSLYNEYEATSTTMDALNIEIDKAWSNLLDTKHYAYGYILEKRQRQAMLDKGSVTFATIQKQCSSNDGLYASDALMHYAIGKPIILDYEMDIAREMHIWCAVDSLAQAQDNFDIEYKLDPIKVERRLFIEYSDVSFGSTNYYNASNPIPEVKIYDRGTIYRILLGKFKTKQALTLFKGVQPLYIARNSDNMYCYYTGGFATEREAENACKVLKGRGFKSPEICRWHNGVIVNLNDSESTDKVESDSGVATPVGRRYMVGIATEQMSNEMRSIIEQHAPSKRISRSGIGFVIGTFSDRDEAEMLRDAITEAFPKCELSIDEIELK